jgi:phage tail-like protein
MDSNGLRFWSWLRPADWRLAGDVAPPETAATGLQWSAALGAVRLARRSLAPALSEDQARAQTLATAPSTATELAGTWAFWDPTTSSLRAAGAGTGSTPIAVPPDDPPGVPMPTDIALGFDDILYVARNGGVVLVDLRNRFPPARTATSGFQANRLAPAPGGGVWALDRTAGTVARLTGQPLRTGPFLPKNDDIFQPVEPNPDPPMLRVHREAAVPAGHAGIDLACSPAGVVMVLAWRTGDTAALLRRDAGAFVQVCSLAGLHFPFSLAFLDEGRVAVLATNGPGLAPQAFVYDLDIEAGAALPSGELYPLVAPWPAGFAKGPVLPPRYPVASTDTRPPATLPAEPVGVRPLRPLSRASYVRSGQVVLGPADSSAPGNVWHRLYLEASIPEHCGVRVWLHAGDTGAAPDAGTEWHPHVFGSAAAVAGVPDAAAGAWLPDSSELPFHPGLLQCPLKQDRTGLFTALVQRPGRRVRALAGRYLWLRVELIGNSLTTPEIAALRVHGARFAYRDRYLPAFYRENTFAPDADVAGPATPPDFLDRFLGLFEGALTQIEDRVAGLWLLTDPGATASDALEWLASWIGIALTDETDPQRRRQILLAAPFTARLHGTLGGLMAALELATGGVLVRGGSIDLTAEVPRPGELALARVNDQVIRVLAMAVASPGSGADTAVLVGGGITSGALVAVEAFRIRRTFATILGADLADTHDPLTQGIAASGNSFVGDTLFLGDPLKQDFLALFRAETLTAAEQSVVAQFLDTLASRVLVLVHDTVQPADWRRLRRIAEAASPAHVSTSVVAATARLIVGVASLVGIDTFLAPHLTPGQVTIGSSRLGLRDLLSGGGLLDPRGEAPASALPIATIDGPTVVDLGKGFMLSAMRSRAAPGRTITRYVWLHAGAPPGS